METAVCVIALRSVWTLLDVINIYLIYDKFLLKERKPQRKIQFLGIGLVFLISYIYGLQYAGLLWGKSFSAIVVYPYCFKTILVVWFFFKSRKKDILLILFYQLLVTTVSQGVVIFIGERKLNIFYDYIFFDLCEVFTVLLMTLLLGVLLYLRKNNNIKIYFVDLSVFQYVIFCLALLAADALEAEWFIAYSEDQVFKWMSILNVAMVCVMMCQIIMVRESDTRKGKIIDVLDEQMEKVTGYCHEIIEKETQTKKFRHDIRNLLLVLHSMVEHGENEKALEYIEKMNDMCKVTAKKYDTGNFVADTLLNVKSTVAEEFATRIVFEGYVPSDVIESVDMVILLSNILDNAVEACEQIKGEKVISIESILKKQMWILVVKNPAPQGVKIHRNRITTTKNNKELHGYGIQNMERVVQKYDGNLKLECRNGVFTVQAMLLLKKRLSS